MRNGRHFIIGLLTAAVLLWTAGPGEARKWVEEDFWPREVKTYSFTPPSKPSPDSPERTVIGQVAVYQPEKGDTFFDLARYFDLGYNELQDANPEVDEWIPGHFDKPVIVPQQFILPSGTYDGIVINIPEMRLYYYRSAGKNGPRTVTTFPVGLGREEWKTPIGKFTVREKTVNPTWVIPESIRKERIADRGYSETMIPGGDPTNPLGKYRMRLTLDLYGIHGTNIPWGVGMLVSHGCVRLYPEDIEKLYPTVPMGTSGVFVYQPIKVGMADGRVYVEVHKDLYGMKPGMYRETRALLEKQGYMALVDEEKLRTAVLAQSGMPVDVTLDDGAAPRRDPAPQPLPRPDDRLRSTEVMEREHLPAHELDSEELQPVSDHAPRGAAIQVQSVPAHAAPTQPASPSARRAVPSRQAERMLPAEFVPATRNVDATQDDLEEEDLR